MQHEDEAKDPCSNLTRARGLTRYQAPPLLTTLPQPGYPLIGRPSGDHAGLS